MEKTVMVNKTTFYTFASTSELLDSIESRKTILVAVNSGKLYGKNNPAREIINRNTGYIDGIGALLAAKKKGAKNAVKIPGCELWLQIIERFYHEKSFYFLGATQEVIETVISKLRIQFDGIKIAGYKNGFYTDEKYVIDEIVASNADVVFVAMGSPKQELFMEAVSERMPALYMGLGGSFDVYSGKVKRAPRWVIKANLEGTYRFLHRPKSLFKRHMRDLLFLFQLWLGKY